MDHLFGIVVSTSDCHPRGAGLDSRIYPIDHCRPVVLIIATGSEVRGFKPARGRWIFQSVKILSMTSFGRE